MYEINKRVQDFRKGTISPVVKLLDVITGLGNCQGGELKVFRGLGNAEAVGLVLLYRKLKSLKMIMAGRVERTG